jgi:hypothetical protein
MYWRQEGGLEAPYCPARTCGVFSFHARSRTGANGRLRVRFIDGFAPFFREPADVAVVKYFIRGDVHFNALGNRLLFEAVRPALGDD